MTVPTRAEEAAESAAVCGPFTGPTGAVTGGTETSEGGVELRRYMSQLQYMLCLFSINNLDR
jgi:hypothetical protein